MYTQNFTVTAGLFVRRTIFTEIEAGALRCGLNVAVQKAGNTARFELSGPKNRVDDYVELVKKTVEDYQKKVLTSSLIRV